MSEDDTYDALRRESFEQILLKPFNVTDHNDPDIKCFWLNTINVYTEHRKWIAESFIEWGVVGWTVDEFLEKVLEEYND